MIEVFSKIYRRVSGESSRFFFFAFNRQLTRLTDGDYFTRYAISKIDLEDTNDDSSKSLSRGLNCIKIIADSCSQSIGWQNYAPLFQWLEKGKARGGHISDIGWKHSKLVELAKESGLRARARECLSELQVCKGILDNELFLASVSPDLVTKWRSRPSKGGHFVIVLGFKISDLQLAGVYVLDPDETSLSEQFISIGDFKNIFSGRGIFFSICDTARHSIREQTTWVEIDLAAIGHNMRQIRSFVGENVSIMAVVKSNAYGHGIVEVSNTVLNNGAKVLAVASMEEAMVLRENNITAPILILYGVPIWEIKRTAIHNVSVTIFDISSARAISAAARKYNVVAKVHIQIDTGMGWLGLSPADALEFIHRIRNLPNITIEGIFSHLANSDVPDQTYTLQQIEKFKVAVNRLKENMVDAQYYHIANSAAILRFRETHFNMVRPGLIVYGLSPCAEAASYMNLIPALQFKTRIIQIRKLSSGESIGYGSTYTCKDATSVGVLPVGYFDGISRLLSNKEGEVLVRGRRAPIIGTVCMNMCMIDVTHVPEVRSGDEVVIIGSQEEDKITVQEIANRIGSISYEILTNIGRYVPRVFKD